MIRKLATSLFAVVLLTLTGLQYQTVVYAQTNDPFDYTCSTDVGAKTDFCKNVAEEKNKSVVMGDKSLMVKIVQIIVYLVGGISVLMIIIGGFRYVVSGGDSNGVQGAKNTILYALVGLVVAVFAEAIVAFVLSKFT